MSEVAPEAPRCHTDLKRCHGALPFIVNQSPALHVQENAALKLQKHSEEQETFHQHGAGWGVGGGQIMAEHVFLGKLFL